MCYNMIIKLYIILNYIKLNYKLILSHEDHNLDINIFTKSIIYKKRL